ncbi:MAG: helix-turn-helix domain-containing protein [Chloroflexota bacterium]|nr:helix-turn-helix domain-containing protein [Chloroflexota bacterium]
MKQFAETTASSGNVYADLGFDDPEAEMVKAELAIVVSRTIGQRQWAADQAARALDIKPGELAAIRRGRLGRTSLQTLIQVLRRMRFDVEIAVLPTTSTEKTGRFGVRSPSSAVDQGDMPADGALPPPRVRDEEEQDVVLQAQGANGRDRWRRPSIG